MSTKPLLEFSTLEPERPYITIDGDPYELSILSDFGLTEQSRIARLMTEATELQRTVDGLPPPASTGNPDADMAIAALGAIPEPEAKRLKQLLDEIIEMILRAPDGVRAKLREPHKRALIEAFTPTVAAATPAKETGRTPAKSRSTSASSSRSSRRRTATVPG